jgi:hypothetical protein
MKSKDKASDLVCDFYKIQSNEYDYGINWEMAKQCALIAVDEIIKQCWDYRDIDLQASYDYWQEVKKQINKL